jgi:hypothetical protein
MSHQLKRKQRKAKAKSNGANHSPKAASPVTAEISAPELFHDARTISPESIQRLHQTIGNQAVQRLLEGQGLLATSAALVQREDGDEGAPAPKTPAKTMIDKAKAVEVLQNAYKDYVTKIEGGKVEVLAQADFQAAYDKIYGKTKYAWDKYVVKPHGPGNLEGFAHEGTNYINKDIGSVDVVPHEMLHNNTHDKWTPFAGSELDEGTTEYLTIKAVSAAKYTPSHSYPDQEGVVQELVKMTSDDLLMKAYFKGETDGLKTEMETKCKGTWSSFKDAMQKKDWVKAKGFLKAKETK